MGIKIGDRLPGGTLHEYVNEATESCAVGPRPIAIEEATKGKRIAVFGLPGAYTPTCSAKHLPGYIEQAGPLKSSGIDEIWCLSVNDAFVMGAWGREHHACGKVRMMGDGSGSYARALGLELDLTAKGMGMRAQRFSMIVKDGVVTHLNVEGPGKFEVSDAGTMLKQAKGA